MEKVLEKGQGKNKEAGVAYRECVHDVETAILDFQKKCGLEVLGIRIKPTIYKSKQALMYHIDLSIGLSTEETSRIVE